MFCFLFCPIYNRHASSDTISRVLLNCSASFLTFPFQLQNKTCSEEEHSVAFNAGEKKIHSVLKRKLFPEVTLFRNFVLFPCIFRLDSFHQIIIFPDLAQKPGIDFLSLSTENAQMTEIAYPIHPASQALPSFPRLSTDMLINGNNRAGFLTTGP